jgi:hypothetical protein
MCKKHDWMMTGSANGIQAAWQSSGGCIVVRIAARSAIQGQVRLLTKIGFTCFVNMKLHNYH